MVKVLFVAIICFKFSAKLMFPLDIFQKRNRFLQVFKE